MNILVFDIETKQLVADWDRPWEAGLAVAVTWTPADGFTIFTEGEISQLAEQMAVADALVGYNSIGFDLKALIGMSDEFEPLQDKPHYDMCRLVGAKVFRRVRANELLSANLGTQKTGDGANAPALYQSGDLRRLWAYCINDVERERDLFFCSQRNGFLLCPDKHESHKLVKVPMPKIEEVVYEF